MRRFLVPAAIVMACAAAAWAADDLTPVNPYHGMQTRADVFKFAERPKVEKQGDKWIVTFATTDPCDATVSIVDADGRIVRHLASGVLGKNAPYPFQQDSLAQKLEWDGLADDFTKAPAGCSVRVSLGLKADYALSGLYDPYYHRLFDRLSGARDQEKEITGKVLVAKDAGGDSYVISKLLNAQGRVYDKDGKYLRTFFPPSAADVEKVMSSVGYKFTATEWGDRTIVGDGWFGPFGGGANRGDVRKQPVTTQFAAAIAALKLQPGAGEPEVAPLPKLPAGDVHSYQVRKGGKAAPVSLVTLFAGKGARMAADRQTEKVYFRGFRLDGRTGKVDTAWFPNDELKGVTECAVGPDYRYYVAVGGLGYGNWIARFNRDGKLAGFTGDGAVTIPAGNMWGPEKDVYGPLAGTKKGWWRPAALTGDGKILYTGVTRHSNTHERGLYVSPNGAIVMGILFQGASERSEWAIRHGVPREHVGNQRTYLAVWDKDGNYITSNAVGDFGNGHGVAMDRDGNVYLAVGGRLPAGQDKLDGSTDVGPKIYEPGTLVKIRGRGGKYPLSEGGFVKGKNVELADGALWSYGGLGSQRSAACTCHNVRWDMDYWARTWLPENHLFSVMVLDANGNRVARIGRYGNADDADPRCGKIHFAWMRALCVSDTALYVWDQANLRILKAALSYAAEETLPLP